MLRLIKYSFALLTIQQDSNPKLTDCLAMSKLRLICRRMKPHEVVHSSCDSLHCATKMFLIHALSNFNKRFLSDGYYSLHFGNKDLYGFSACGRMKGNKTVDTVPFN